MAFKFTTPIINSTKLRNAFKRQVGTTADLTFKLSNININGRDQGCSGFITDNQTGRTVYVSTDINLGLNTKALYRNARDTKDYHGMRNRYAPMDADALATTVLNLISSSDNS